MIQIETNTKGFDRNFQEDHLAPAVRAATEWIEDVLKVDLPINTGLRSALASGEILCCLLNTIVPGAIKRINRCPNRAAASDNLSLFLNACEAKCGIPKSKLFDIDNFEDIFDRNSKSPSAASKAVKHTEKVVIAIFWLAKFVEQEQKFANFPTLDYSAFADLLPVKSTHITQSVLTGNRSLPGSSYLTTKQNSLPAVSVTEKQSESSNHYPISMGNGPSLSPIPNDLSISTEQTEETNSLSRQISAPTSLQQTNNHAESSSSQGVATVVRPPIYRPLSTTATQQRNNNGTDEDDWQANLDAWRERRRQITRLQAKTLTSFEEIRQEEEKRRQAAARERLKQLITEHSIVSNPYIASASVVQPPQHPISPGLAILTGRGNGNFDFQGTSGDVLSKTSTTSLSHVSDASPPVEVDPPAATPKEIQTTYPQGGNPQFTNGSSHQTTSETVSSSSDLPNGKSRSSLSNADNTSDNGLTSTDDYQEVQLRIQSKPKSVEVRWGMTLVARGPSNTAPFVVEHVKIGSTADMCDINRGDILVRVHHTDVRQSATPDPESLNLAALEELLDCLSRGGQPIKVHVLRKRSNMDELEEDNSTSSAVLNQPSSPSKSPILPPNDEPNSDVDEHEAMNTALVVNPNPSRAVNSIELVKQLSHELKHVSDDQPYSTIEKQSTFNSRQISKAFETEPFVSANSSFESTTREPSSHTPAFNSIPATDSLSTRI